ncbi:hypothetical protein [Echinimonas agarilytica]|uniref:Cytosol aminopeptidase domain-containing protein n=1 Tax=Echinimonas agarilytica TaxID=1215918 RepID=A0AA42B7Z0_9GAMM|nr:hypothetical protein [Echinimonas agarilytica]MCM2680259.1 hypothetical protein [Echinimonas agarilytica]
MPIASLSVTQHLSEALDHEEDYDCLIIVLGQGSSPPAPYADVIAEHAEIDNRVGKLPVLIRCATAPGKRIILVYTGPIHRDYDDVRRFYDAGQECIQLALSVGVRRPLLYVVSEGADERFRFATSITWLGTQQAIWHPLEAREKLGERLEPIRHIGLVGQGALPPEHLGGIEYGLRLARDLAGSEPERMTPLRFAEYCQQSLEPLAVSVNVNRDVDSLKARYPLLMGVARASLNVERHHPCVVRLEYAPEGPVQQTLLLAGKGVTYDTGGADLKVGGAMAGMSRDKGGAASVAGFVAAVAAIAPPGLRVVAELGLVRNSIGADAFVPDEIIESAAGVRVRIGNTDAEGRLVLADLLTHLKTEAQAAASPELFSVATLTGHAARAVGPYTALVENGPAREQHSAQYLQLSGDLWADPAEISRVRREDYDFVQPRTTADDVLSSNNAPSSVTARGHQYPMAFLAIASGLNKHGYQSEQPLSYTHIDIAGSGVERGDWQHGKPTAAAVLMLLGRYVLATN